ncbi:MAG: hypothetical protein J6V01_01705 [Clostridia bacterium]|nr:hypothetical protein [Clostridia bacterium]
MNEHKYDGIIDLPHHVSERHPQLGKDSYAAQFSPFAALTGYEGVIEETARATDERPVLDDEAKERLSARLSVLLAHLDEAPVVSVTCFVPDKKKSGGSFATLTGRIKSYSQTERIIIMSGGERIPLDNVYEIRGEIIDRYLAD